MKNDLMFTKYPDFSSADTRYAYAAGRIRALETRLLDRQRLDRMLDADSAEECLRMLQDTDYGAHLAQIPEPARFEGVLELERKAVHKLFRDLCLDGAAISIHFSRFDFHNVKVLVKAKCTGRDWTGLLSEHGECQVQALEEAFSSGAFEHLPAHLAAAAVAGMEIFRSSGSPRQLDIALDRAGHDYRLSVAGSFLNQFVLNLVRLEADVHNIVTLYRVKWLGEDYKLFHAAALHGGFLEMDRLKTAFSEAWEGTASSFAMTPYREIVEAGARNVAAAGSFSLLEKAADDYIMGYLRLTKMLTFGVEPLFAYLLVKGNEMRSVRMIMLGKLYGIPVQRVRERLPGIF